MKIIWDNLREVKKFIDLVGLKKLCKDEEEWGGLGFIITGRDVRGDGVSPANESYTLRGPDFVVVSPYWKELCWLFRNTFHYPEHSQYLTGSEYLEGFWLACTGFMIGRKNYSAKRLVDFVIDFLADLEARKKAESMNSMRIEAAREAEKAFNEELRFFQQAAALNRKAEEK